MSDILKERVGEGWYNLMKDCFDSPYFAKLGKFLTERRNAFNVNVFPEKENVFRAFKLCPLENLKVVIIGQDPYPTKGHANGLAFAYTGDGSIPRSLANIFKEWENDVKGGLDLYFNYSLEDWAKQGILLINTALTVEEGKAGSHTKQWRRFTEHLFERLAEEKVAIVYVCWGNHAKSFIPIFNKHKTNLVIQSAHPSPLSASRGFFNSKPFSKINKCLKEVAIAKDLNPEEYIIKW